MENLQWINDLEWKETVSYDEPENFEVVENILIQRKNIEEFDCSEYETEKSGGKAYRYLERKIPDNLYETLNEYVESVLSDSLRDNQLDIMDAIADVYMAIESR